MKKYYFIVLTILLGCASQKYSLERNPKIQLVEAFYKEVPPAIKDEKSTTQIYVELQSDDRNNIRINGIFYKNQYLKQKENAAPLILSSFISNAKIADEDFPFELRNSEFVIDYMYNNKRKYALFSINRKSSLEDIPR